MSAAAKRPNPHSVRNFARAMMPFARTPFLTFTGQYPQGKNYRRNPVYSLNVFISELWKQAARKPQVKPGSFLAMESFSKYIAQMDDILDQVNAPRVINKKNAY